MRVSIVGNVSMNAKVEDLVAAEVVVVCFEIHWPRLASPPMYFFPPSLAAGRQRLSMDTKCVIVDRTAALVTSANLTATAGERNIEAGVLTRHAPIVDQVARLFVGLIETGTVGEIPPD